MDDPWANAWGEPEKHSIEPPTSEFPGPSYTRSHSDQVDTALPSWTTGTGILWTDPSDTQPSLWTQPTSVGGWESSSYESISINKVSSPEASPRSSSPQRIELTLPSPIIHPPSPPLPIESPPPNSPSAEQLSLPTPQSPTTIPDEPSTPIPGSPDAFGNFESGIVSGEDDPWMPSKPALALASADSNAWGTAWEPDADRNIQEQPEPVDEWEAAKRQKAKQDQYVPPELLASILHQFEGLSSDLWPEGPNMDIKIPSEQDYRSNWQGGLEGVEGLVTAVNRLIPQNLTLPPSVQFTKTFTSKHMADALRGTRSVSLARVSPMAQYTASKGSTAWEASVRSRPEAVQDDFVPAGWKVVEKDKDEQTSENSNKKKPSGGLLSFFGRRATTPDGVATRSRSPVGATSKIPATVPPVASAESPQSSVGLDGTNLMSLAISSPPATAKSASIPTEIPNSSDLSTILNSPATTVASSHTEKNDTREPSPPPSAVSRFLSRFARPKATAGSSPHNSIALSSNDLEFLSDIVPSAKGEVDTDSQLQALSSMIESPPLPTKLPQPLAPPPRPPSQPTRVSSRAGRDSPFASKLPTDDFVSLFDSPGSNMDSNVLPSTKPQSPSSFSGPSSGLSWISNINPGTSTSSSPSHAGMPDKSLPSPFDMPPSSLPPTQKPVSPPKRTLTAVMSASSASTPVPKSNSPFKFPPPPSSQIPPLINPPPSAPRSLANTVPPVTAPIPPPTQSSAHPAVSLFDDDDGFADFHSSPSRSTLAPTSRIPAYDSSFSSSVSSNQDLFLNTSGASVSNSSDSFDDFDEFVSSPIRTTSPPRPPAKTAALASKPLPPPIQAPSPKMASSLPQPASKRKMSRAANHSRTVSLLEIAASRPGKWPAPPSPLPEALPPPGAPAPSPFELDLFGGDSSGSTMQTQQRIASATLATSASSPAALSPSHDSNGIFSPFNLPPPPNGTSPLPPSLLTMVPSSSSQQHAGPPASTASHHSSSAAPKPGGLSAQDLSFFEGL